MTVMLIGKKKCGVCDSAKKKLDLMQIPYDFVDIEEVKEPHDEWRNDKSVDALAFFNLNNCVIPTIVIDKEVFTYSAAMARLKGRKT
jgi:glutaredoxin